MSSTGYSNYIASIGGNTGNTVNTYSSASDVGSTYVSPYGLSFTPYVNAGQSWISNCIQGNTGLIAPTFSKWGFGTGQIFCGVFMSAHDNATGGVSQPIWEFNYLPVGTYIFSGTLSGQGYFYAIISCYYNNIWNVSGNFTIICPYTGLTTNINNPTTSYPTLNIFFQSSTVGVVGLYLTCSLYKIA